MLGLRLLVLSTAAVLVPAANAQSKASPAAMTPGERRVAAAIEALRASPVELRTALLKMPKGSDLHNHLYGALYAETWIRDAAEDRMCLDPAAIRGTGAVYSQPQGQPCGEGKVPADQAFRDPNLYNSLVDAFSMRGFVAAPGVTGHDHFFHTFARFDGISTKHLGEWFDEVASRAAR